ncbi:tyrosine-type recombinase/integrase [Pseudonocardia thermophila]|uniref:tyrosine-type recombinase/integrase n=1 Tax=Pseudonocardia thermophila TaxID=1848 RepID=UPI00248F136D|nr:tyrosine-type recombinase/integrase [Pseudonocardia thermophila]
MADLDLSALASSWELHLRAERKTPQTIRSYLTGVRLYLEWCQRTGRPAELDRHAVRAWVAELLDSGAEPATARARQLAVKRFSAWLADEGEIDRDDLVGLKPPKLDTKVVEVLTEDQLAALIKVCQGKDFQSRRDEAIIRLMIETGARAEEIVALTVADVDLHAGVVTIRRGKGGKGRRVAISPATVRALDRYLRLRRQHRMADLPQLWLGSRRHGFTYYALHKVLRGRAEAAGIPDFHPHKLRHTMASRWLERGGSEGGLMATAGWSRRDMIDRYTRATAEARAMDEARRLQLGDL